MSCDPGLTTSELQIRLSEVRQKIRDMVRSGVQSYGLGRRNIQYIRLEELRKEERYLMEQLERLCNPAGRARRVVYWDQ